MATEAADSSGHHSAAARIRWRFSSANRRATRSPAAARGCYANSQRPLYDRGQRCNAGRVIDTGDEGSFVRFRSACPGATAGRDMDVVVVLERPFSVVSTRSAIQ